jgi:hypothetical protein
VRFFALRSAAGKIRITIKESGVAVGREIGLAGAGRGSARDIDRSRAVRVRNAFGF